MKFLRQSTASQTIKFGPMVDATDGVTLEVGLATAMDNATTGLRVSKAGGTYADRSDTTVPAYDAMGDYTVTLNATDTSTVGRFKIIFEEAATCLPHWEDFTVLPAVVYDAFIAGTDNFNVNVAQWLGTAAATPTTAGVPEVDVTFVSGTAQTANDNGADINAILLDTGTTIPGTITTMQGNVTDILADTNEIQGDWADGGRLDLLVDGILLDTGTTIPGTITTMQGNVTDILADTNAVQAKLPSKTYLAGSNDADGGIDTTEAGVINGQVDSAIETYGLDNLVLTGDATVTNIVAANTVFGHLMGNGGAVTTYDNSTDSLEAIRTEGDASWGNASTNPNVLLAAEIATFASQTEFTLATGSTIDDVYLDQTIVIYDDSASDPPSVRKVTGYTGSTRTVTIDEAPNFTLGADDSVRIFVTPKDITDIKNISVQDNGTAQAGGSATITLASTAEGTTDDYYKGSLVYIASGTGANQSPRAISGYTASTRVAAIAPAWTVQPSTDSVYYVIPAQQGVIEVGSDNKVILSSDAHTGATIPDVTTVGTVTNGVTLGADAITAANIANDAIATEHLATGAISADTLATDTITAAKIAAGAITGTEWTVLDATAISNLQNDYDVTGYTKANSTIGTCTTNTDMRGTDSAALASVCTEGRLAELDAANIPADLDNVLADTNEMQGDLTNTGRLDTIFDNILTDTGTTIPATLGTPVADLATDIAGVQTDTTNIEADTQNIQSRIPTVLVSGRMSSDAVSISGSTEAADNLEAGAETVVIGAAATGTLSTTAMTTNLTEATNDHYNGRQIIWTSGVLQDQATDITDYDGTSKMLTFTAVTEAPSNGDTFVIV